MKVSQYIQKKFNQIKITTYQLQNNVEENSIRSLRTYIVYVLQRKFQIHESIIQNYNRVKKVAY